MMADVKWIKITTDMFDNRKIKHLRKLPEGDSIVLIWVMLLTMAGRCNSSGMIFLTENIPYTPKMLADELDFEENTVILALNALEQLNMIVTDNGFFSIAGWEEYQSTEKLAEIREYNRLAKQKQRAKQKALPDVKDNVKDKSRTSQLCQGTDIDKEEEREREEDIINISPSPKAKKPVKHKYGEYQNVLLTDEELEKLKDEYFDYEERIERLSTYIESSGKKYKSHYATIRMWAKKDKPAPIQAKPQNSTDAFFGELQRLYDEEC